MSLYSLRQEIEERLKKSLRGGYYTPDSKEIAWVLKLLNQEIGLVESRLETLEKSLIQSMKDKRYTDSGTLGLEIETLRSMLGKKEKEVKK